MGLKTPTGNWVRTTPRRGRDFVHKLVPIPSWGPVSTIKRASLMPRWKRLERARAQDRMMRDMLTAIGRNPVYNNSYAGLAERGDSREMTWTKKAKAWLDFNMKRYVTA